MKNLKQQLLTSIGNVYDQSKECKIIADVFEKIDGDLTILADYFQTTKSQSFFISMVFVFNYKGFSLDINDLVEYFDCNPTKLLEYSEDFEELASKEILIKEKSIHRAKVTLANDQFVLNKEITDAIMHSKPMPDTLKKRNETVYEFLEELYCLGQQRESDKITTNELFEKTEALIVNSAHFPLVGWVSGLHLEIANQYLYLYMIWKNVSGKKSIDLGAAAQGIFGKNHQKAAFLQAIMSNENELIIQDLIEVEESSFFDDSELKLTQTSLKQLQSFGIKLFANSLKKDNIINPNKIQLKELVFNPQENKQIEMVKNVLRNETFSETQMRLQEKGLPKGISILLHGSPGTGKTEVVYQIAKETNREIFKVEISQSKSMWFGESEKIIKRIFTDYKNFAKECEIMPILLFNEADAIISKRKDVESSGISKTENAIQNILLEELENFQGIMFATTNLTNNLDSAFERRFLFKIQFTKPNIENRNKIWQNKLNQLTEAETQLIAQKFDFSGGQIDNIARKSSLHEIINGIIPTIDEIIDYCNNELIKSSTYSPIGFRTI
jgi:SpoVK/Ycf46/Vps4 family AAA+-type ATPase